MAESINVRLLALEILLEVEKKNSYVKDILHKELFQRQYMSKQDRAFLTRLVEGVTEYQIRLDYVINLFSKTKISRCKPCIRCLLRMGAYQILYMDSVPDMAACNECVKLAKKKGFSNLAGFVNGVLRSVVRNREGIVFPSEEENVILALSIQFSMPQWLVEEMIKWYGLERTKYILRASIETADLTIRVNERVISKEALKDKLISQGIEVSDGTYVKEALHLKDINYVRRTPGFLQGEFFVQDESSMLLYQIAGEPEQTEKPLHVLDVCAAPGGKVTHFAQKLPTDTILEARDVSAYKIERIEENIERLAISNVQTKVWDALVVDTERFGWADIVIADLPCSGLGILSKKNDIKYHLTKEQLQELCKLQRDILKNAASYVKPNGILLYSTCTIHPGENIENATWFEEQFDFEAVDIKKQLPDALQNCLVAPNMVQLLPGEVACDGFFIAKFRKKN